MTVAIRVRDEDGTWRRQAGGFRSSADARRHRNSWRAPISERPFCIYDEDTGESLPKWARHEGCAKCDRGRVHHGDAPDTLCREYGCRRRWAVLRVVTHTRLCRDWKREGHRQLSEARAMCRRARDELARINARAFID